MIKHYVSNIQLNLRQINYPLEYNKLEYFSSKPRMDRFLAACNNSKSKAQNLYRINLRVSQAFYPVLNIFEIFLRNTINYRATTYFSNPDWIIDEKNGFMNDPGLRGNRFFLRSSVIKAEAIIIRKGGTITSGKVIAEQSLGFWTSLFEVHHYRLLRGSVIHVFPNKPAVANRSLISQKLTRIREFRNRIYHNEPICFEGRVIDFAHVRQIRQEIYDALSWMDSELIGYVDYFDAIDSKIDQANYL